MKKRLTGAIVLVALAVIFVPMLLDDKDAIRDAGVEREIPLEPVATYRDDLVPGENANVADQGSGLTEQEQRYELPVGETQSTESSMPETTQPAEIVPAEKPVVTSSPPHGSGWVVQAGSFGQSANADKLLAQLTLSGRKAFVEKIDVSGKTLYRVRIGPEKTREAADKTLVEIEKEFNLKGKVISYP